MTTLLVLAQMIFATKAAATIRHWAFMGPGRNMDCLDVAHQISLAAEAILTRTILPSALQTGAVARTSKGQRQRRQQDGHGHDLGWGSGKANLEF